MAIALDDLEKTDNIHASELMTAEAKQPGLPFTFTGQPREYFGIWIVNLLLSIVTLGIYSAWAKVRAKRYFYGNTRLDGSSFDYSASPVQILKGRLIAFALFVAYAIATTVWPLTVFPFLILMFLITPWAIVRARAFNARYSSYRNVSFSFKGGLGQAFRLYVLWPIAAVLTLGAALPYLAYRNDRFFVENSRYGRTEMSFTGTLKAYYRIYGMALLIAWPALLFFAGFAAAMIWYAMVTFGLDPVEAERVTTEQSAIISDWLAPFTPFVPILLLIAGPLGVVASAYLTTKRQNYLFDNTRIGPHRLALKLDLARVLWIRFTNLVVIALSVGLMIPWATIRMTRYQIEQMSLIPDGDLDTAVSQQQEKNAAYGDEMGEGMDLDLGLGV